VALDVAIALGVTAGAVVPFDCAAALDADAPHTATAVIAAATLTRIDVRASKGPDPPRVQ
jgi:hypothetical protein